MDVGNQSEHKLAKMRIYKLLMLGWRSFSQWGDTPVAVLIANISCQYIDYA